MMYIKLFSLLTALAGVLAVPLERNDGIEKRALPRLGGVNLAGCDFGMSTDGTSGSPYCPSTDQIGHFVSGGANLFRLPVGWQYLVGSTSDSSSTSLNPTFFATYDNLVQTALKAGAYVLVDVHNYARWNGKIIGQGGPSNTDFANLWSQLAKKYASQPKVIFGIMNEPHDLDVSKWATTVQAAVNAIRAAGATTQAIAIPGTDYTHAQDWVSGADAPLLGVTDPATGDKSLLILDVHQYLDGDGSGQSTECTTDNVARFTDLANWLKSNGRKAIVSETGGGNTASCITSLGNELKYVSSNADVFTGFAVWSAGSFDSSYALSITPVNGQDNNLYTKAVKPYLPGANAAAPAPSSSVAASSTSKSAVPSSSKVVTPVSSSKSMTTSSSKVVVSTSSKAVVTPPTSKAASTTPTAVKSTSSSSTKPATSSAAPTGTTGANLQKYTGAPGGIAAPPVYASGSTYKTANQSYNFLTDALHGSCYAQMQSCQQAANQGGNKAPLTVDACNNQVQACLAASG